MKTIYFNAQVYTGELPLQEAFATEGNYFIQVGTKQALTTLYPEATLVDLYGKFVCAGFNDSHMHLLSYGSTLNTAALAEHTTSLKELLNYVGQFIIDRETPQGQWVKGRGWNHDFFSEGAKFPTRYDLDRISLEHPICLTRACGHACVVNSKALELIGVTSVTTQPIGGQFDIDEKGNPLGIFRETAMDMVYAILPKPTLEEIKTMIQMAAQKLNGYGITSCQSDDFVVFQNVDYQEVIEAYRQLEEENALTVRVYEQNHFTNLKDLKGFVEKGYNTGIGTERFKFGPLKMLGDGSLGARTAYMSVPYADDESTCGIPVYNQQVFDEMIGYAHQMGMQVAIHAIGDGILDCVLSAIQKTLIAKPQKDHRHGIVHCQIMRPDQIKKFKELELHAYVQTIFLDYDIKIVESRIGKERAATSYNFKTMLNQGVVVSNGSDCPVELPDCMAGIECAVTRQTIQDHIGPYLIDQAMSVQEALDTFTIHGAHSSFEEKVKGKIQEGMLADFVVLSENPLECDPYHLHEILIEATYLDGKQVFQR